MFRAAGAARARQQHRGGAQVARAASTLQAEVMTPAQSPGMPSDKVFTKQDFDNLLKGYRSLVEEHDYWISEDMVEGGARSCTCTPLHMQICNFLHGDCTCPGERS